MAQKEEHDFTRDSKSIGLLNTNKQALDTYKSQRNLGQRISSLENDVTEIKQLLTTMINKEK
jgi:hypothetical protein|tara:strand:+ start:403 stop:588 length:186 start_codon:yes stop_codon:yes gene_type:complete